MKPESASILSIHVGKPKDMTYRGKRDSEEQTWSSGIFKDAAVGPVYLGRTNLDGDGQADLVHHGGPDRAVLLFAADSYPHWGAVLGKSLPHGSFGENFTVEGLNEDVVCLGDLWETDRVRLEISQPRLPCFKLGRRLVRPEAVALVMEAKAGGWYCRVLQEGLVEAGDTLRLVARPHPDWTIRRAFHEFVFGKQNHEALHSLRSVAALSELWKDRLDKILSLET